MHRCSRSALAPIMLAAMACSTTTGESAQMNVQLTGTFTGIQEGTTGAATFMDEQIIFLLLQVGDSVSGTFDVTGLSGGNFRASVDQNVTGFFIDFVMEQATPCMAEFAGRAEARTGTDFTGQITVALSGSYTGDDCNGPIQANFFVQQN